MKISLEKLNINLMFISVTFITFSAFFLTINPILRFVYPVLMLILIPINIIYFKNNKVNWFLFILFIFIYFLISIFNSGINSALFGLYVFIVLIYSMTISYKVLNEFLISYKFWLFILFSSVFGVIYVNLVGSVYQGVEYEGFGSAKQISKDWTTSGINRNPGFTDSSVTVAALIVLSGTLSICGILKNKIRILNVCISILLLILMIYATILSTTKTMLATIFIIFLIFFFSIRIKFFILQCITFLYILASFFFLFYGRRDYWGDNTLLVRFYSTWPESLDLLKNDFEKIIGGGLGAIGAPLSVKGISGYPADNFLVYLYVIFGFFSILGSFYFLLNIFFIKKIYLSNETLLVYIILLIGCLTYNVVELPIYSVFLGAILLAFFKKNSFSTN